MRNRMYGGVRGRKTKVGEKLLRFPPTRFSPLNLLICLLPSYFLPTTQSSSLEENPQVA